MKYPDLGGGMLAPNVILATLATDDPAPDPGFRREWAPPIISNWDGVEDIYNFRDQLSTGINLKNLHPIHFKIDCVMLKRRPFSEAVIRATERSDGAESCFIKQPERERLGPVWTSGSETARSDTCPGLDTLMRPLSQHKGRGTNINMRMTHFYRISLDFANIVSDSQGKFRDA